MALILDRYAEAIRSRDMKSEAKTLWSDSDVIGAAGYAGRRHCLAMALQRLFLGDNAAAAHLVDVLAGMAWGKAAKMRIRLKRAESTLLAQSVIAWHRNGTCKTCNGHGFMQLRHMPVIGTEQCRVCKGIGRMPFERQFPPAWRILAQWLVSEIEREQCVAGPEALKALAPMFDL